MNVRIPTEIAEATRLTREGRLTEATALLQRVLRGDAAPTAPGTRRDPATIDMPGAAGRR